MVDAYPHLPVVLYLPHTHTSLSTVGHMLYDGSTDVRTYLVNAYHLMVSA